MSRVLKNAVWYYVIMQVGVLIGLYAPLEWYLIPLMFILSGVLYIVISNVRSTVRF